MSGRLIERVLAVWVITFGLMLSAERVEAATTTCATVGACIFGSNTGAGFGVRGSSKAGDGVAGYTYVNSTSPSSGKSGISGYDASTNKSMANSGVYGTSAYGYGVHAKTKSGTGVFAEAIDGTALFGESQNGIGVEAYSSNAAAIRATGIIDALDALSIETCCFQTGTGIWAYRFGPGASIAATAHANMQEQTFPDLFDGSNDKRPVAVIDYYGNEFISGGLYMNDTLEMSARETDGSHVGTFAPRVASPTIEDTGVGRLARGRADVALDPAFARTLDPSSDYLVFVTPRGDSNGLYVARTSATGFVVRENRSGTSTVAFDYRIVAKPYDTKATRLPPADRTLDLRATTEHRARMENGIRAGASRIHSSPSK